MVERTDEAGAAADGLDGLLDDDYAGDRDLPLHSVLSSDGTKIAYEVSGSGPAVVVIGGGLNDKDMMSPIALGMSERFKVYNYDRRGRGDSEYGDPDQYTIEREIDDLAAVIEATGEPAMVFGNCTGGIIAVHAAAAGVPMAKLALYEPPYLYPKITPDQMARLKQLLIEDRREEAVTLFGVEVVGFIAPEALEKFKLHPAWQGFEANAPSMLYDAIIDEQHSEIPYELLPKITAPTFLMCGSATASSIRQACDILAEELPHTSLVLMEGDGHLLDQKKCAPLVMDFFES
jgi:pimeloyl-ACP methyl ester carboxylesterase